MNMQLAAQAQAVDRAEREGRRMFVYRSRVDVPHSSVTWYVRSEDQGVPEDAVLHATIDP